MQSVAADGFVKTGFDLFNLEDGSFIDFLRSALEDPERCGLGPIAEANVEPEKGKVQPVLTINGQLAEAVQEEDRIRRREERKKMKRGGKKKNREAKSHLWTLTIVIFRNNAAWFKLVSHRFNII